MSEEAKQEESKVQVCANKEGYTKSRTAEGKPSLNCGDAVATAFIGLNLEQKYAVASELVGVKTDELKEKYGHLNKGMQGMSLANRVRGALNKDAKLEKPAGLADKLAKIVAPVQAAAKKAAEEAEKARAVAKAEAEAKKAEAKKAEAEAKIAEKASKKKAGTKAA